MDKEGHIDLEKLSSSVEVLSSMENIINLVNFAESFEDIEKCFRQTNFEHSNCLSYKESLETIYYDIEFIKRRINELSEAIRKTIANYMNINSFSEDDIKEFSEIYKISSGNDLAKLVGADVTVSFKNLATNIVNQNNSVTTVPVPETTPEPTTNNEPINTWPIGIAIGATGIAGSIGAVILDDIYSKREGKYKSKSRRRNELEIEDYNEDDIMEEDYDYSQIRKSTGAVQGPYQAARLEREADRFYGNQLEKMKLADDEEYLDDDDDDYEDF